VGGRSEAESEAGGLQRDQIKALVAVFSVCLGGGMAMRARIKLREHATQLDKPGVQRGRKDAVFAVEKSGKRSQEQPLCKG